MTYFWLFTSTTALSKLGNTFLYVAAPWSLLQATGSPLIAALGLACQALPYLVSPLLGVLIDRGNRRSLYVGAELIQAAAVACFAMTVGVGSPALSMVLLTVVGLGGVVAGITSEFSLLPDLVPPDQREAAYGRYTATVETARLIGPACAGVLIGLLGTSMVLWCDAITFLATALVGAVIPVTSVARGRSRPETHTLRAGFRMFRALPDLTRLTGALCLHNLGAAGLTVVVMSAGKADWDWSPDVIGAVISGAALGTAAGAWCSSIVRPRADHRSTITRWFLPCLVGALVLPTGVPALVVAGLCLLSFGEGGMNATTMAFRNVIIPAEYVGRVNAIIRMAVMGSVPVSYLLLGWLSDVAGTAAALLPAPIGIGLSLLLWCHPKRHHPSAPHPRAAETFDTLR